MRVLFVAPYVPSPVRVRPYHWIRVLSLLGHQVHLVALRPPEDRWAPTEELEAWCDKVELFDLSRFATLVNGVRVVPSTMPFQAAYSIHPMARQRIRELAGSGRFDVVHVEHLRGVALAHDIPDTPKVLDAVDSISELFEKAAVQAPGRGQRYMARLDLGRTRRFEARLPFVFDRTLVTSSREAAAFLRLAGPAAQDRLSVLTNGVDVSYFSPATGGSGASDRVLFSGKMSYHANTAAALWLAQEIMPHVWKAHPTAKLVLAGKDPPEALLDLVSDSRIEVTGYVEDMRTELRRASLAVAPLRYGAGIQNKVLEAMACGVPVVATPAVCEALRVRRGTDVLVAETAEDIAQRIVELLARPALRGEVGDAGRRYVAEHHDWTALGKRLVDLYREAGVSASSRPILATS